MFFNQIHSKKKKYINIEIGANVRTPDIESALDGNSLFKINPLGIGLKRFSSKSKHFIQNDSMIWKSVDLENGITL